MVMRSIVIQTLGILFGLIFITYPGNASEDVQISIPISDQERTLALLRLPKAELTQNKKLPVLIILGGFESAAKVLDLVRTDELVALASFDYPFKAERKFKFPESLKELPNAKALFPKTVRGIHELISSLQKRKEIDPKQMIVVGASFGTPFAVAAASQNRNISGLVIVHGFGLAPETLYHVIRRSWMNKYGWLAQPIAWLAAHLGWIYLDIPALETYASSLVKDQSVLMITAAKDTFIPKNASDSLWRAFQKSKAKTERIIQDTDHLMPGSENIILEMTQAIIHWMQSTNPKIQLKACVDLV